VALRKTNKFLMRTIQARGKRIEGVHSRGAQLQCSRLSFCIPETWNESGDIFLMARSMRCVAASHLVQRRLAAVVAGVRIRIHRQHDLRRCAVPLGARLVQRRRAAFIHLLRKHTHASAEKPLLCGFDFRRLQPVAFPCVGVAGLIPRRFCSTALEFPYLSCLAR
jgi:hypothetical protein